MKARISSVFFLSAVFFITIFLSAFKQAAKTPWVAPDKAEKMTNPVKSDANSLKEGKELWIKHCQSCHGKAGLGDGSKAAQLKTEPGDLSAAAFQKQSNGGLFYKISEGRSDMPSFKKKVEGDEDIWNLVNYIRTLKK
ncbi:MAG: c-type cytochrome [Bacteroidota bacterium]